MKKKKHNKTTIKVSRQTAIALQLLKTKYNYRSIDQLINDLILRKNRR